VSSLQPWQVQSLIAAIAVVATIALTSIGWVMAMRTAKRLQDRDREHRQRSVARALSAEVRRIGGELGPPPESSLELSIYGSKPMVPSISHWVETVMVDAAAIDPEIVANFMTLERQLHNLRGDQEKLWQTYDIAEKAEESVTRLKGSMNKDNPDDIEALAGRLGRYTITLAELERNARKATEAVDLLEHLRNTMDKSTRETLVKLENMLNPPLGGIQETQFRKWSRTIPWLSKKLHHARSD
jgi:hypothetical protein